MRHVLIEKGLALVCFSYYTMISEGLTRAGVTVKGVTGVSPLCMMLVSVSTARRIMSDNVEFYIPL